MAVKQNPDQEIDQLMELLLLRRGITWDADAHTIANHRAACEDAAALLRKYSGNPELPLMGEHRDLAKQCALYLVENKRAEFLADYRDELVGLRLEEAFGIGAYPDSDISR